jgi:FlaA1/EpsC-like NDP-sugar epimerase
MVGGRPGLRFAAILLIYAASLILAFALSYAMRWDFAIPGDFEHQMLILMVPIVICKLLLLQSFGQFRTMMSYFGLADFGGVVAAMAILSAAMMGLWYAATVSAAPPRGVILMDLVMSVGFVSSFRISLRVARDWCNSGPARPGHLERRIAIVGAGDVGEALAKDLLERRSSGLRPVLFIDDDPKVIGRTVHGLPVYGPMDRLGESPLRARIDELVITLPDAPPKRIKEIVEFGRKIGAATQIVPSVTQLASGQVKVERSRPVAIEDLLRREPVNLDSTGIDALVRDKTVLVTGAGGSIGSELCRQILGRSPFRLIMVDQTEFALFEIEQELLAAGGAEKLVPLIADVTDEATMRSVFERHGPSMVFHAAAHKHVPLMERQPSEAIRNNALATALMARLASEAGVDRFVLISTDKAINPTSVMGCSKRLAEKAVQARQRAPGNRTAFLAVRFGNVLGSSGSVVPTFRRQIAQGGPVTVTHRDMTRYFMTIPEAVGLVLQTAALGSGGEIFILDMGEPVKIMDMARQMIELSGYKPDIDIEIKITGMRPGEKLFEELSYDEEGHAPTEHERIFKLLGQPASGDIDAQLADLAEKARGAAPAEVKRAMKCLVPEYVPFAD